MFDIGIQHLQLSRAPQLLSVSLKIEPICMSPPSTPNSQMAFLRTRSNGRFRTCRAHAETDGCVRLCCIFGSEDEPESLQHYVRCKPFRTFLYSLTNANSSLLSTPPAPRICLVVLELRAAWCVIAFQVFHVFRNTHSVEIISAVLNPESKHIAEIACHVLLYIFGAIELRWFDQNADGRCRWTTYLHTYIHVCMTYIHACMHTYIHIHTYIRTYIHT